MSSMYNNNLKLSIFGESHGPAVGMVLDGIPAGLPVDREALERFLNRRAPGRYEYVSARNESDSPEFLSGISNNHTSGTPIAAIIQNKNVVTSDYALYKETPRPGHADFVAQNKFSGYQDHFGGGHFSGRLTAPLCIAGGLCLQWLKTKGITIGAHIYSIAETNDVGFNPVDPEIQGINSDFPVLNRQYGQQMIDVIMKAKADRDSVGGIIECAVTGLPIGLGDPIFDSMESRIAQLIYGIPAIKGLEFGLGFAASCKRGSQNNDAFIVREDKIVTETNHCGGILGGITNGMPLIFRVAIKPTPSISLPQKSVHLPTMKETTLQVTGRHDPCIVPRAVPVVEAAAAIAVFDAMLSRRRY